MAPRSPTRAFDPTPALEHNRGNFSPLNGYSTHDFPDHASHQEVHFADPPASMGPRHSIATTHVPLLESVSSASHIPRQAFRITDPPPGIDINAYIENSRNLIEQLRQAHETERKAWDIERSVMKAKIADLEFKLNRARDPKRRSSNDSSVSSIQSFRADFRIPSNFSTTNGTRKASDTALLSGPPVWKGPEFTPPVTRVFSSDEEVNHLPSISEDEPFPDLSKEVSPTSKEEAVSIPIEQIDNTLEGITLRSTGPALRSSFVATISSPSFSPARSPSPRPPRNTLSTGVDLAVDMKNLLDPLDEKLKRYAGHTPMAFDGGVSTSATTTNVPSPKQENPVEPASTAGPPLRPSEDSDTYFSVTGVPKVGDVPIASIPEEAVETEPPLEAEDDRPLKGPLMLDPSARSQAATTFLDQVDAKLLEAAANSRERSDTLSTSLSESVPDPPPATGAATNGSKTADDGATCAEEVDGERPAKIDDDMPRLRMKSSTNFGSAWGHAPGMS
jgi:hypothetical protein